MGAMKSTRESDVRRCPRCASSRALRIVYGYPMGRMIEDSEKAGHYSNQMDELFEWVETLLAG